MSNNDWTFTSTWWDPYASQWQELGFFSPGMLNEEFGGLWFGYDPQQAITAAQYGEAQVDNLESNYLNWATNQQNLLNYKQSGDQIASGHQIESFVRDKEMMNEQHVIDKKKVIHEAVARINEASDKEGKLSISGGTFETEKNIAVENVYDQVQMANTTNRFANRKIDLDIEHTKDTLGHFDADGIWHAGRDEILRISQYDADNVVRHNALEQGAESVEFATRKKQLELYEDWVLGQTDLIKKILWNEPYSASADEIDNLLDGFTWDFEAPMNLEDLATYVENFDTLNTMMFDLAATCESMCMEDLDPTACINQCSGYITDTFLDKLEIEGGVGFDTVEFELTAGEEAYAWFEEQGVVQGDEISVTKYIQLIQEYYTWAFNRDATECSNADNYLECMDDLGYDI
jgi:hypothetical protein